MQEYSPQKLELANKIFVRRCKKVLLNPASTNEVLPSHYVATVVKTIEALGFGMSADLIAA